MALILVIFSLVFEKSNERIPKVNQDPGKKPIPSVDGNREPLSVAVLMQRVSASAYKSVRVFSPAAVCLLPLGPKAAQSPFECTGS